MRSLLYMTLLTTALGFSSCSRHASYRPEGIVDQSYIHRYGMPVPPERWSASGGHGQVVTTLDNGVIVCQNYSEGNLDGETSYTFPHSEKIERIEAYAQGTLAKELTHYSSGAKREERVFISPEETQITAWYESGSPCRRETMSKGALIQGQYYTTDAELESQVVNGEGLKTLRDSYGHLLSVEEVKDGQVVSSTTYYPQGSPQTVTPYLNGSIEGVRKTYLPGGEPSLREEFRQNQLHGTTIVFQNGEKKAEIPYVNGMKQGMEKQYKEGERLAAEVSWINGQKHGPSHLYLGESPRTDWFFQDKPVSKTTYDWLSDPVKR